MNELTKVAEGNDVGELLLRVWQAPKKSSVRVYHPKCLDLVTGLEPLELDMDWVWVAEKNGQQICAIVVGNFHKVAFLMRMVAASDAPPSAVLRLLREAGEECQKRGMVGFVVMFELASPVEKKLWKIAKRFGAIQIGKVHTLAMGWRLR